MPHAVHEPPYRATISGTPVKRINYAICIGDATAWSVGMALWSLTTIVPLFLVRLHSPNILIGLLPALINIGYMLPGMLVARRISRLVRAKWWLWTIALVERVPLLVFALLVLEVGPGHSALLRWGIVIAFGVHAICLGLNQPAYWTAVGKIIPIRQRGRVFGLAGLFGGLGALFIDPLTRFLLTPEKVANLRGFGDSFLIGSIVLFAGAVWWARLDEPAHDPSDILDDPHAGHFWHDAVDLWRGNRPLRRLIYNQSWFALASMATPFFVLEYASRFHVSSGAVADFTTIGAALGSLGSLGWGMWGDHHGNKGVLVTSAVLFALTALLTLAAPNALAFYGVFALSAISLAGNGIASGNVLMEFVGEVRQIPFYTALFNAASAPLRIAAPLLGGFLADRYGYGVVFWITVGASLVAAFYAIRMAEPRKNPLVVAPTLELPVEDDSALVAE